MTKNMTVLVTGASGTLGAAMLPRLAGAGCTVRPTSRSARAGWVKANLSTGEGLAEAVRGATMIVHLASSPGRARQTDVLGTRRLVEAAASAGVGHLLYVSIAGADRVPFGYYQAKVEAEAIIRASGIPFTILRATQFFPFVERLLSASSKLGPVIVDPSWLLQPVAAEDVADQITNLLLEPPAGPPAEASATWAARTGDERVGAVGGGLVDGVGAERLAGSGDESLAGAGSVEALGVDGGRTAATASEASTGEPAGTASSRTNRSVAGGVVVEFGGPEVLPQEELARQWLAARGSRRPVWGARFPGRMAAAVRAGGLLAAGGKTGTRTWRDFLAAEY